MDSEKDLQTVIVKKSYDKRRKDLMNILYFERAFLPNQIQIQWTNFLELTVEPIGWRAVWKMSRDVCLEFNTVFPTIAVVMVEDVDYEQLTTKVKIIAIDDRVQNIPELIKDVPLVQLYPTVKQDNMIIDIQCTADALENLRIFYNHLWYPWDEDEDNGCWITEHLENRLKLYYDFMSREVPQEVASKISELVQMGHDIFEKIKEYLCLEDEKLTEQVAAELGELYVKLSGVKDHLTFLENKSIRDSKSNRVVSEDGYKTQQVLLAWQGGISNDLISVMQKVKSYIPPELNQSFSSSPSLQKLLDELSPRNTLFIGQGIHYLKNRSVFGVEGTLQGVEDAERTVVSDLEEGLSLLEILGKETLMSTLSFSGSKVKFLITVRFGKCKMSNVKVMGKNKVVGIFVYSGAEFYAENCVFSGCSIAIEAASGSTVRLENCTVENNMEGLVFQDSKILLENCRFVNNSNCAVKISSFNPAFQKKDGGVELLESLQDVTVDRVLFKDNKVDVLKC